MKLKEWLLNWFDAIKCKFGQKSAKPKDLPDPTLEEIETELIRVRFRRKYVKLLRSTLFAVIVTVAFSALIATFVFPVLQIYGSAMSPTLAEGDIVMSVKNRKIQRGDIISFYCSNQILVKRVIGVPTDTVDLTEDGDFYINGALLEEPYLTEKARGECDVDFPLVIPADCYFVVGDNRATSIDSRTTTVGTVAKDEIIGRLFFTVYPLKHFGKVR